MVNALSQSCIKAPVCCSDTLESEGSSAWHSAQRLKASLTSLADRQKKIIQRGGIAGRARLRDAYIRKQIHRRHLPAADVILD